MAKRGAMLAAVSLWVLPTIALAQQQPPPPPAPPPPPPQQTQPPPPPQPDPPRRRRDDDEEEASAERPVAPAIMTAMPPNDAMAGIRPYEEPVIGFGNDDLWSWSATRAIVGRSGRGGDSDIAVGSRPD